MQQTDRHHHELVGAADAERGDQDLAQAAYAQVGAQSGRLRGVRAARVRQPAEREEQRAQLLLDGGLGTQLDHPSSPRIDDHGDELALVTAELDKGAPRELRAQCGQAEQLLRGTPAGQRLDRPGPLRSADPSFLIGLELHRRARGTDRASRNRAASLAQRTVRAGEPPPTSAAALVRSIHARVFAGDPAGQDDAESDLPQLGAVAGRQGAQLDGRQARPVHREVTQTSPAFRHRPGRMRSGPSSHRACKPAAHAQEHLPATPELVRAGERRDGLPRSVEVEGDAAGNEEALDGTLQMTCPLEPGRRPARGHQLPDPGRTGALPGLDPDEHGLVARARPVLPTSCVGGVVGQVPRRVEIARQERDPGQSQLCVGGHHGDTRADELVDRALRRGGGLRQEPQIHHRVGVLV